MEVEFKFSLGERVSVMGGRYNGVVSGIEAFTQGPLTYVYYNLTDMDTPGYKSGTYMEENIWKIRKR